MELKIKGQIAKLNLYENDVIVITTEEMLNAHQVSILRNSIKSLFNNKVLFLTGGLTLSIISKDQLKDIE